MNLTALQDVTAPVLNLSNANIFTSIIDSANSYTNNYLILASMLIIMITTYFLLSDMTPLGDFLYDDMRAFNIATTISALIGLTVISVGWSGNFVNVGMFVVIQLITFIIILIYENRE